MRIDTLNITNPWDSHLTPTSSPANILPDGFTHYGTDQALTCQYSTGENFSAFDSCFYSFLESQPDFSSPHELPDLPQRSVSPLMTPGDRTLHPEIAGYDFHTGHIFASPIWPSDENEYPGSFELSDVAKEVETPPRWGLVDDLESFGQALSHTRTADGTSEEVPRSHQAARRSQRKHKVKPVIELPQTLQKNSHRCDFPGCSRTFRRTEHLKRHIKTLHNEAPESFFCEFCGKNNFSRRDNLRTHRKLHARRPGRNSRVGFVPDAALIVEEEVRSKNARVLSSTARMV